MQSQPVVGTFVPYIHLRFIIRSNNAEERSQALRPLVERYVDTPVGPNVLRMAMLIALELGDSGLANHLREMIAGRYAGDLEMISFQRDKLGGQVIGASFTGIFQGTDGKTFCFPMDGLGRSTMLFFWSKKGEGAKLLQGIAAASAKTRQSRPFSLEALLPWIQKWSQIFLFEIRFCLAMAGHSFSFRARLLPGD